MNNIYKMLTTNKYYFLLHLWIKFVYYTKITHFVILFILKYFFILNYFFY
jgi:hypothetical protein